MEMEITRRQKAFIDAQADEVLFGGAAGGGKSYGQLIDALLYALRYPKSRQLILRRTFPDLERSLIMQHLALYPRAVYRYNSSNHRGIFSNGSVIEFGYCDNEQDVYRYQGAEYDTIRFDELTHFTESMYRYLISRLRGTNSYPKQVKSSTNPGGVGHDWVKARFIDSMPPDTVTDFDAGTRLFLPSKVQDNRFLLEADPGYIERLRNLSEKDQKALLLGDWDIFEGRFFTEFSRRIHVCAPFEMPGHWRRYVSIDYGLDMLAALWIVLDEQGSAWVYRELYKPDMVISQAAKSIKEMTGGEQIDAYLAPPDLFNRRQETGRSVADIFYENGLELVKTSNDRTSGWLAVKEWLKPFKDEQGIETARLKIFAGCLNIIRTLPALQHDDKRPNDVASRPHELTHAPDALRGFCVYWSRRADTKPAHQADFPFKTDMNRTTLGQGEIQHVI